MLSRNLEQTLHRALDLARERRHWAATLEHALLALADDADAALVLRASGVDVDKLKRDLSEFLDKDLAGLVAEQSGDPKPVEEFQRVVQRAAFHVQSAGRDEVTGANVLVALFSERESNAVHFLQSQDMTRLDAVNFIAHGIAKTPVRSQSRPAQGDVGAESNDGPEDATAAPPGPRAFHNDIQALTDAVDTQPKRGFDRIAEAFVETVEEVVNHRPANTERAPAADVLLTVALLGAWGSGKSTLAALIAKQLRRRKYICIRLNPWKWGRTDDVYEVVLRELQKELVASGNRRHAWFSMSLRWMRKNASRFFWIVVLCGVSWLFVSKVDWGMAPSVGNVASSSVLVVACAAALKFVLDICAKHFDRKIFASDGEAASSETLSLAYKHIAWFERLRWRTGAKPIVFFIDDLDRCAPDRVAAVLESVHAFTVAGSVTFLMCDRDYVEAALFAHYEQVAKHHPDGANFGRRYLDKIVQIAFHVPAVADVDFLELGLLARPRPAVRAAMEPEAGGAATGPPDGPGRDAGAWLWAQPGGPATRAANPVDRVRLSEIAGEVLLDSVQDLGLNIRQIKNLRNTLKLYLAIAAPREETAARRIAAFVLANAIDRDWLDDRFHGADPCRRRFPDLDMFYAQIAAAIPEKREDLRPLFSLVGRHPAPRAAAIRTETADPRPLQIVPSNDVDETPEKRLQRR